MTARTPLIRSSARLAALAVLTSGLAACFAAPVPVISKGERLPLQGRLTCRIESDGPPTIQVLDTSKPTVAADGGVSYAVGDKTLTVRKAPTGLWLLQYGKAGRYDYGYAKVEGDGATIYAANLYGYPEGDLTAAQVRAVPAGHVAQLVGDDRRVEAFLLSRKPEQLFKTGACASNTVSPAEAKLFGPFQRTTTKAQALSFPGTRECDGNVCFGGNAGGELVEATVHFSNRGTIRTINFHTSTKKVAPGDAAHATPVDVTMITGEGMKPVGIILDDIAAYLLDGSTMTPGFFMRMSKYNSGEGKIAGAIGRGEVKRVSMTVVDAETRGLVQAAPNVGAYVQAALEAGGVAAGYAMFKGDGANLVIEGYVEQLRAPVVHAAAGE